MLDYTRSHLYYANINGCMSFGPSLLSSTNNGIVKSIVFLLIFVSIKDLHNIKIMSAVKHFFVYFCYMETLTNRFFYKCFIQFSTKFNQNLIQNLFEILWRQTDKKTNKQTNRPEKISSWRRYIICINNGKGDVELN